MAKTIEARSGDRSVKKWSAALAVDTPRNSYFGRKMMGKGEDTNMPIMLLTELENDAGETISFDLSVQLKMAPIEGDGKLAGSEEALTFYTDTITIDQLRGGVNAGGRMTRKRTKHDLRATARKRMTEWWNRVFDELIFIFASGDRGINDDFVFETDFTGISGNTVTAPDAYHHYVAGASGQTAASLTSSDVMTLQEIDRVIADIDQMGGGTQEIPKMQGTMVEGEEHFVMVMNGWTAYQLRKAAASSVWIDIQKALIQGSQTGMNNPIFKGGLGMHQNVVLQKHQACIRFDNYGSGSNLDASRSLVFGKQAVAMAFGSPGDGIRFQWHEEEDDRGNEQIITSNTIVGIDKTRYNGVDYGVYCVDTYAPDPTTT